MRNRRNLLLSLLSLVLVACTSKPPSAPSPTDDTAARIRIAHAEARRGDGVAELLAIARGAKRHERLLALRALGRVGGPAAIAELSRALSDPDRDIVAAAAAGIGLAASLDDKVTGVTGTLLAAGDHVAVVEALGRAADTSAQPALVKMLGGPHAEAAAIALGRHGRRKIAISGEARAALAKATADARPPVRYAATWALAREHVTSFDDPGVASVTPALIARIADDDPETRAQAIAALARRKQVKTAAKTIEQRLIDPDWRVAVEAVRALAGDDHRAAIDAALARGVHAHVEAEATRSRLASSTHDDVLKMGGKHHVVMGQLAEWVKAKGGTVAERRAALDRLLADGDARVRAAGIGVLASTWSEGDDRERERAVATIVAAIASKDPITAGAGIESVVEIHELATQKEALEAALVQRALQERDLELAASLYGVFGKRAIRAGADACRQGLGTHPVRQRAAVECLRALGETVPLHVEPLPATAPDVDVASVIGKRVRWKLTTTRGVLAIELLPDVAPWAVAAVVALTRRGFYDGLDFHRVVPNFVVQGGDPTESGWGGPGFTLPAEPSSVLDGEGFVGGGVGIADAGPDSGGSQWFVMHSRATHLDGRYTWIGRVVEGGKSADALRVGDEITRAEIVVESR